LALAFSKVANPLTRVQLIRFGNQILEMNPKGRAPLTGRWLAGFLRRHGEVITERKTKEGHKKDIMIGRFPVVCEWIEETEIALRQLNLDPDLIFNIDETRATPKTLVHKAIGSVFANEFHQQTKVDHSLYTLLTCISASGKVLFCLYLFRATKTQKSVYATVHLPDANLFEATNRSTRSDISHPVFFAVTPAGYMNGETYITLPSATGRQAFRSLQTCCPQINRPNVLPVTLASY
jgi:hypothetical protein